MKQVVHLLLSQLGSPDLVKLAHRPAAGTKPCEQMGVSVAREETM